MNLQALFDQAIALHRQGNLPQAEQLYRQVVQVSPETFRAHYLLGVLQAQQGRNADALASYERSLRINPDFAEALYNHGVLLWQMRRPGEALKSYDKVLAVLPRHAEAHYNRGVVLAEMNRFEEAVESYDSALALQPDFVPALGNRGIALWTMKLHDAALESYDRALTLQPDFAAALYNRGLVLADMKRFGDAVADYDRALRITPDSPDILSSRGLALLDMQRFADALASFDAALALAPGDARTLTNRGVTLGALKRPAEALASHDRALAIQPGLAAAWNNRAQVLRSLARYSEALTSYDRMLALDPSNADGWNSRGSVLRELKRPEEALASYSAALAIRPDFAEALNNRGYTQWADLGRYQEAAADYQRALAIDPDLINLRGESLHLKMYGGDWRDYEQETARIDEGVRAGRAVVQPFIYQAMSQSPADLQACSRIYAARRFASDPMPQDYAGRNHKKIRIGYLSAEFRDQATASLMAGLYECHDKDKFEIVAIDNGASDGSPMRARLEAAFDKFVPIAGLPDRAAAEKIRAEEIDILVNLNGYFGQPRMGIFARRPAPLQVNYLGFPATLGADYIDYILADRVVIPAQERQYYTEQVVWLPDSYQANDSRRSIAAETTRAENNLPEDAFVFCNFNQGYKVTPSTFGLWMSILKQVEDSVLWLLDGIAIFRENLGREAERHGVARERLVFAPFRPLEQQHLARLQLADLFLDTLPYNAHTTASDALWAGLPLLTLRGTAFPGRVAASLLAAAGLPEQVTETPQAFVELAVALARDPAKLKRLRGKLAKNRLTCPLFDTDRFRRHIEAAYATMWDIAQRGEPPRAFAVERLP